MKQLAFASGAFWELPDAVLRPPDDRILRDSPDAR
jgi:hypothetical protein